MPIATSATLHVLKMEREEEIEMWNEGEASPSRGHRSGGLKINRERSLGEFVIRIKQREQNSKRERVC